MITTDHGLCDFCGEKTRVASSPGRGKNAPPEICHRCARRAVRALGGALMASDALERLIRLAASSFVVGAGELPLEQLAERARRILPSRLESPARVALAAVIEGCALLSGRVERTANAPPNGKAGRTAA